MVMAHLPEADERLWATRLRWRLRGAWQWPVLWLLTVVDAVVLHTLPFSGEDGSPFMAGFLVSGFLNLGLVALAGPAIGALVRRRRPDLPKVVASDRAAVLAMGTLLALLLAGGIANHGTVAEADRDADVQLAAARRWFARNAPARFHGGIGNESVLKAGPDLFRTCIPGPDPDRNLCVYVNTSQQVPTVREDPDERPNSVVAGPDNPGRR